MSTLPFNQILPGDCKIVFSAALALIVLTSCKPLSEPSDSYVSKQAAIDAALEIASIPRPEISGSQVKPSNIKAEQMTLNEAVKHKNPSNEVAVGYDPNMMVWFVTMEGVWLDEFPRPEDFPTPVPYHHYSVILDAKTGLDIEISASP